MTIKNGKDLFVMLLSNVRQHEDRITGIYKELSENVQDPEIKESLDALAYLSDTTLATLDKCFKIVGQQPVKVDDKFQEIFIEDFRREINEMQSPLVKNLYIAAKAKNLISLRIGELKALIAMSDISGHRGVGLLLESCLAQKVAFIERTRRRIRTIVEREASR